MFRNDLQGVGRLASDLMSVREILEGDEPEVRRLLSQLVGEGAGAFSADRVRQGRRGVVAEDGDGRALGFLYGSFLDLGVEVEGGGYIDLLVVDEQARGQGIGEALVDAWKQWLLGENIKLGFVATTDELDAARFYERCGFSLCRGPWLVWSAPSP